MPRYGLALVGLLSIVAVATPSPAQAKSFSVIYQFCSQPHCVDGKGPVAGLVRDTTGNLYGTTLKGGSYCECGTVFKLAPDGTESVLHAFSGLVDGSEPYGGVIADKWGNLYGTTYAGGGDCDCGAVFKISPRGTETILHGFGSSPDGAYPRAGLVRDTYGNLYGTTENGGVGYGTVFRISKVGAESVLYAFPGGSGGAYPEAGLIIDANGDLFGTTAYGGAGATNGVVFEFKPDGTESILYSFRCGNDGCSPRGDLIEDKSGNLYGTTYWGGNKFTCQRFGCGTVFTLSSNGTETILYKFGFGKHGAGPSAGLVFDNAGNLYGTTSFEGAFNRGTLFNLAPNGSLNVLHDFTDTEGESVGDLLKGPKRVLYGTTGSGSDGVVFQVTK